MSSRGPGGPGGAAYELETWLVLGSQVQERHEQTEASLENVDPSFFSFSQLKSYMKLVFHT